MAELKFCPKCGAERENGAQKCSCGFEYPKKGLSTGAIVAIVLVALFLPSLAILGIVAALTIPTLVNRQSDIAAQVRLKKAVASYEDIAYVYMLEHDKKNLAYAFGSNCERIDEYFKVVEGQGCNFTTVDGVYWEFDPVTGFAAASDSKETARYGVVLWAANGTVNDETRVPANVKVPTTNPTNCTYYPATFLKATPTQLKELCKK